MAFAAAGLNCVAVGPTKLYIYNTTETLTAASAVHATYGFNTTNCPGMSAGDIIFIAHNTNAAMSVIRLTEIASDAATMVAYAALA